MIKSTLFYAIETLANGVLSREAKTNPHLQALEGSVIGLTITDWELTQYWVFEQQKVRIVSEWYHPASVSISGPLAAIAKLGLSKAKVAKDLTISGDLHIVETFKNLFHELNFDWQGEIAPFIGDANTFALEKGLKSFASFLRDSATSLRNSTKDYVQEEARLTPSRAEFEDFSQDVRQLQRDIDKLQSRQPKAVKPE